VAIFKIVKTEKSGVVVINMLKKLKRFARNCWMQFKFVLALKLSNTSSPRIFYLMGLNKRFPNLGDQAQAAAIPLWFDKHFAWPVIQIKNDEVHQCLPILQRHIQANDIVFLHSGGNFGDDWYQTQLDREKIINALQNNPIIQLPQTVFYSDTASGKQALTQTQQVLAQHPQVLMFGRDHQSTALSKQLFPQVPVHARPDMVLSLHDYLQRHHAETFISPVKSIRKLLLILRNDKEGVYQSSDKQYLMQFLKELGFEVEIWDTDVDDTFTEQGRMDTLVKYFSYIASFDAVITDRYHGLIFSVLLKRPCVVLKTHNHKLTSAFDWFEQVNFDKRADTHDEIKRALASLAKLTEYKSPNWNAQHFDPMANEVKTFLMARSISLQMKAISA
jgi:exopolysaccharide biosynthesis predicted pyruvyltransferase EpsI